MKSITEYGPCPILEQAAEECTELAQVCLKLARKLRGENPTDKSWEDIWNNLCEELDHVVIAIQAICETNESGVMILAKQIENIITCEVANKQHEVLKESED